MAIKQHMLNLTFQGTESPQFPFHLGQTRPNTNQANVPETFCKVAPISVSCCSADVSQLSSEAAAGLWLPWLSVPGPPFISSDHRINKYSELEGAYKDQGPTPKWMEPQTLELLISPESISGSPLCARAAPAPRTHTDSSCPRTHRQQCGVCHTQTAPVPGPGVDQNC